MSWTLTSSGAIIAKAGVNVNTTAAASSVLMMRWSDNAEGRIVSETRRDWVGSYVSIPSTEIKVLLDDVASSLGAMQLIAYDMDGYGISEATTMLDVQRDNSQVGLKILKDFKTTNIHGVT